MLQYEGQSGIYEPGTHLDATQGMINNPGAQADPETHQKYILAGTPVGASKNFMTNKDVTLQPTTNASQVQGIVGHTINITNGAEPADIIYGGTLQKDLMKPSIQQIYNDSFIKQLSNNLPKVTINVSHNQY